MVILFTAELGNIWGYSKTRTEKKLFMEIFSHRWKRSFSLKNVWSSPNLLSEVENWIDFDPDDVFVFLSLIWATDLRSAMSFDDVVKIRHGGKNDLEGATAVLDFDVEPF